MIHNRILQLMKGALGGAAETALAEVGERHRDPFSVLIATVLSHRTRDEKTAEAASRLLSRFTTPEELSRADEGEVAELIRGVGFYRNKARAVIEIAKQIRSRFGGKVPSNFEELISLPSVGRKTANCVLVYGFGIDAIPVDTHVHRIANRLGIVKTRTPEETEAALKGFFLKDEWKDVNDTFVIFGKRICRPIGPKCEICPLRGMCAYYRSQGEPPRPIGRDPLARIDKGKGGGDEIGNADADVEEDLEGKKN